jgi:hypothetical protein
MLSTTVAIGSSQQFEDQQNFFASEKDLQLVVYNADVKDPITVDSLDIKADKISVAFDSSLSSVKKSANEAAKILGVMPEGITLVETRQPKRVKKQARTNQWASVTIAPKPWFSNEDINKLMFSQFSIDSKTNEGQSLDELKECIKKEWKKNFPINVVTMPTGQIVSLDNRRLYVAKQIAESGEKPAFKIRVSLFQHSDKAPRSLMKNIKNIYNNAIKRENDQSGRTHNIQDATLESNYGITPDTYGHAVLLRVHTHITNEDANKFGYSEFPKLRA